jgi:hypothetical protein
VGGPVFNHLAEGHEPMIAGDGRLLVLRIGVKPLPWKDPITNVWITPTQTVDIVYSYYTNGGPCEVTNWTAFLPITHAPYDARINQKFGFAMAPFRDAEGTIIPDGEDLGGTYPWMDRQAKNLFFTCVGDKLHYGTNLNQSRYPEAATPEEPATFAEESGSETRGVSFVGLWSHGKIVMIDNLNNDTDYSVGDEAFKPGSERMVNLYLPTNGPPVFPGWLRLGAGRANSPNMPPGDNSNTTILDSLENILNFNTNVFPLTLRDVVWPLHNAKQSDDLVFDDYVDHDAFIVANMAGLAVFDPTAGSQTHANSFTYHSGWSNATDSFSLPVKLQNAATATTNRWLVPKHGLVVGNGRLEPAAAGGVHGKGFWLTGSNALQFPVLAQPQDVRAKNWYIGLFVDCRFDDGTNLVRLLSFPDNSSIWLCGRSQVVYADSAGNILNRISVPSVITGTTHNDLLPDTGWAHLGFQVRNSGTEVDFHLNGIIYNRWRDNYSSLFQMTNTVASPPWLVTLGSTNLPSFTGWIDDFKVFAHEVDLETACNHAGGTLIGLPAAYNGLWKTGFADRYPAWAHELITDALRSNGETNYPAYANFFDYSRDYGVHRGSIPPGTVSLRHAIHFPEGPLFHNAPRPHSTPNKFCITCHSTSGNGGLDLAALSVDTTLTAAQDERRQPFQPFRRVFGRISAGMVNSTQLPTAATNLPTSGKVIDEWMLPAFTNVTRVQSFTLVNADTKLDLLCLTNGYLIDPARLGTTNFAIRANLDSAQGSVTLKYDAYANKTATNPPYTAWGTAANPYKASNLLAGAHTLRATPAFGVSNTLSFSVVTNGVPRVIAGFRADFRPFSPLPGWTYEWNAAGSITNFANYRFLSWSQANGRYTADGSTNFPVSSSYLNYGGFRSTGGNPGRGAPAGGGLERFAIAAYHAKLPGNYSITNSFLTDITTNGNGGQIIIYTDTNNGATFTQKTNFLYNAGTTVSFNLNLGALQTGDIIYVDIGSNGLDGSDLFDLDYSIVFQ